MPALIYLESNEVPDTPHPLLKRSIDAASPRACEICRDIMDYWSPYHPRQYDARENRAAVRVANHDEHYQLEWERYILDQPFRPVVDSDFFRIASLIQSGSIPRWPMLFVCCLLFADWY